MVIVGFTLTANIFGRIWDKIREQSDVYIVCQKCLVIGKIVIQKIRLYERQDTACNNIPPFKGGLATRKDKQDVILQQKLAYDNQHGYIKEKLLIYRKKQLLPKFFIFHCLPPFSNKSLKYRVL